MEETLRVNVGEVKLPRRNKASPISKDVCRTRDGQDWEKEGEKKSGGEQDGKVRKDLSVQSKKNSATCATVASPSPTSNLTTGEGS